MPESPSGQIPLDLGHQPGLSRAHFVGSPENAAALRLIDQWPGWPTPVAVIAGPPGSGKSHLAAIFQDVAGAFDARASFDGALHAAESGGAILLDDADRQPVDETRLFHLINAVRGGGGTLLLTARLFPAAWGVTLADLQSRLKAVAVTELQEPGDLLLETVILKLFADRQVEIDPSVTRYLVRRIDRSLAAASAVVARLDHAALARRRPVTRVLAAELLDDGRPASEDD